MSNRDADPTEFLGPPGRHGTRDGSPLVGRENENLHQTETGIPVRSLYTPADLVDLDYEESIGVPGSPPYTRGIYHVMYRTRPWTIRQLAGYAGPEDTNRRLRFLIKQGATGVNTVFDFVTNRGYDSDHPLAEGDVGQGGVAIDSLEDIVTLYDGIPLDEISVSLVLSHPIAAGVIFAMYLAAAEIGGHGWDRLRGTLQNDFLMETVVLTAPNILRPGLSFQLSMDVVEFCARYVPRWNPISFAGYNYREAGANAVQEVALVIANAIATAEEMIRRGYDVDVFAPRLSSFLTADNDFFEEIAKYRAARRVYSRFFTQRFGASDPRSGMLRFHVQTSGSALTAQQPLNNMIRSAYHAMAAVLGGAQSLHVSAYDEALSVPSEAAALSALRTQQILLHETGVHRTVDPLGGSYYIESITTELDRRITGYVDKIEHLGGLVAAVESGWVQKELADTAYQREMAVASGERKVVGQNCFREGTPAHPEHFVVPDALPNQTDKLRRLRARRNETEVQVRLNAVRDAALAKKNTIPALIEAAKAGATVGECSGVFREVGGGWHQRLI